MGIKERDKANAVTSWALQQFSEKDSALERGSLLLDDGHWKIGYIKQTGTP